MVVRCRRPFRESCCQHRLLHLLCHHGYCLEKLRGRPSGWNSRRNQDCALCKLRPDPDVRRRSFHQKARIQLLLTLRLALFGEQSVNLEQFKKCSANKPNFDNTKEHGCSLLQRLLRATRYRHYANFVKITFKSKHLFSFLPSVTDTRAISIYKFILFSQI